MLTRCHVISSCLCAVVLLCKIINSRAGLVLDVPPSSLSVVRYSSVNPIEATAALHLDGTFWQLTAGQTTANFSAEFDRFCTVSDTNY